MRRIGYEAFIRNVVVALGNGPANAQAIAVLTERCNDASDLIAEHARWSLAQLELRALSAN